MAALAHLALVPGAVVGALTVVPTRPACERRITNRRVAIGDAARVVVGIARPTGAADTLLGPVTVVVDGTLDAGACGVGANRRAAGAGLTRAAQTRAIRTHAARVLVAGHATRRTLLVRSPSGGDTREVAAESVGRTPAVVRGIAIPALVRDALPVVGAVCVLGAFNAPARCVVANGCAAAAGRVVPTAARAIVAGIAVGQ